MTSVVPHWLVIGPDAALEAEVRSALAGLRELNPALHAVADYRVGAEAARSRQPTVALVDMSSDFAAAKSAAAEIAAAVPETALVGAFRPETLGRDVAESVQLIEAIRAGAQDFIRRPVSSLELAQVVGRLAGRAAPAAPRLGTVIAFLSNKGGVGKSTVAVNAGCLLARRHPGRVLLVDASLQVGVCAAMLDLHAETTLLDAARQRARLDETLLRQLAVPHASGLHLLAAPRHAIEGAEIDDEAMARVLHVARRAYDYVLVDTFPLFDRVVMAILDLSDVAYTLTDNVVPTVINLARLFELYDSVGFPAERRRLVVNRYQRLAGNPRPAEVAARVGCAVDHVLAYEPRVTVAANTGRPRVLDGAWFSGFTRGVAALVREIEQLPRTRPGGESNGAAPREEPR